MMELLEKELLSKSYIDKNGKLVFTSKEGETVRFDKSMPVYYIDLFCGAGGVSSGIIRAGGQVIMCVNHDPLAIESHKSNHSNVLHATEDITIFDLAELISVVYAIRNFDPNAIICLWASLECTHFSKAKGGDHREADSRTLAEHLDRYIKAIDPDYIDIENVVEFMSWGPLRIACEKMHKNKSDLKVRKEGGYHMVPFSKKNGKYYMRWHKTICQDFGYDYDFRILNSADFGAITARTRYFGQFKKKHLPYTWPVPTHAKNPEQDGMFGGLKKWKAVKPALELENEGKSIFGRKKELSDNTLKRIFAGLVKYVGKGIKPEIIKAFEFDVEGKRIASEIMALLKEKEKLENSKITGSKDPKIANKRQMSIDVISEEIDDLKSKLKNLNKGNEFPAINISEEEYQNAFITKWMSGNDKNKSIEDTFPTLTTMNHFGIVNTESLANFLIKYHGTGENIVSLDSSCSTLSTKDRLGMMSIVWLDKQFRSDLNHQSILVPAGSVLSNDKHCKMNATAITDSGGNPTKIPCFIMNQFSGGGQHSSTENPLHAITTIPKSNLIQPEPWIFNHNYGNIGSDIDNPAPTLLASRKHYYLLNPQYASKGNDINRPCFTLIARMDKAPPSMVEASEGIGAILIYEDDTEIMKKIKLFMAYHGIIDIKMRMLLVRELLRIQGFGDKYIMKGTQTDQKRFIGNAVEVNLAKSKGEARINGYMAHMRKTAAA